MIVRPEITHSRAAFKAVQDAPAGTFEAIGSVFGNVDLGGDRVMPGAYVGYGRQPHHITQPQRITAT